MSKTLQSTADNRRARGRPRLEDVAQLESNVLDVALQAFLAHGYGGTSMRQIVHAARISKTTLYSRFSSKEELFRAIMQRQTEHLAAQTTLTSAAGLLRLVEGLNSYANTMLVTSLEGDLLAVNRLIYSESHRFPELGIAAAERTEMGISQIAWFITHCAEADGVACRDAHAVAEVFILMLRGWYVNVMLTNRVVEAAERETWVRQAVQLLVAARAAW
jgi:AcrR family transcriptional regulator